MDAYAGIDVAFAKGKALPVAVCVLRDGRLEPLPIRDAQAPRPPRGAGNPKTLEVEIVEAFAKDTVRYLRDIEHTYGVTIRRIAIDAPSDPKKAGAHRREAEQALDRRGISCITTPNCDEFDAIRRRATAHLEAGGAISRLPHANQLWMLVGFALFRILRQTWECLEVFPQATVKILGAADVHKSRSGAVESQLAAAAKYTRWPLSPTTEALIKVGHGALHDRLDAYLAAWVASLEPEMREPIGVPPNDVIWIPKI
jgi:hypothetical protein